MRAPTCKVLAPSGKMVKISARALDVLRELKKGYNCRLHVLAAKTGHDYTGIHTLLTRKLVPLGLVEKRARGVYAVAGAPVYRPAPRGRSEGRMPSASVFHPTGEFKLSLKEIRKLLPLQNVTSFEDVRLRDLAPVLERAYAAVLRIQNA